MKGLLHRLAERAAGTAATLRPEARLSPVGAPPLVAAAEDPDIAPAVNGGPDTRDPAGPPPMRPGTPAGRTSPAAAMGAGRPLFTDASAAAVGPTPHGHEDRPVTPSPAPPLLTPAPPVAPSRDTRPAAQAFAPVPHAPRHAEWAGRTAVPWAEPARLLAPDAPADAMPMPSLDPPAAMPAVAEPTEVHVHIGRIEVIALHEPPAPRRPAPPRAAPVSLQVYLSAKAKAKA
jgi:hypothetical protein